MATTRIMPLHVGKGRIESRAISDIIDYVANPKKTDNGRLITGYACDSRTADAEFLLAKRQYIAATGRVRGADDVIAYHVRQSFRPGEITPEEANRLGVEFAKRFTKGNHAFVVCTHIDKSHMQSIGMTGKQLRRLMVYEGIYYAAGADIIGGAVAAILAVTVLKSALNGPSMWFFTLNITLVPVLVIGVLYLLLAAVIPLIVLHFFNKGTVVERLRTSE